MRITIPGYSAPTCFCGGQNGDICGCSLTTFMPEMRKLWA